MFDPLSKAGSLIRRLQQISLRIFNEGIQPYVLTTVQFGTLQVIADRPGIDQITLAQASDIDRTTVMRVLHRLEEFKLVCRKACPRDKRINRVYITEEGRQLIVAVEPLADATQSRLLEPLDPEDRKAFMQMLSKLVLTHSIPSTTTPQSHE